jgi:hypothetical protein
LQLGPGNLSQLAGVTQVNGALQLVSGLSAVDLPCLSVVTGGISLTQANDIWQTPGTLSLTGLGSGNALVITNTTGLKSVTLPSGVAIGGQIFEIASNADLDSLTPIGSIGAFSVDVSANPKLRQITFGDIQSSEANANVTIGGIKQAGVPGNDALSVAHLGTVTGDGIFITDNPALSSLVTGPLNISLLRISGNPLLSDLSHIPSGNVQFFFFTLDNGFNEGQALAFANRIGVSEKVCQLTPQLNGCLKTYTGPPWH